MKRQYVYEVVRKKHGKVFDNLYFNSMRAAQRWADGGKQLGMDCSVAEWKVLTINDI